MRRSKHSVVPAERDLARQSHIQTGGGVNDHVRVVARLAIGAQDGQMWKQRPMRLAFEHDCIFRGPALSALDAAGISWEMAVDSDSMRTVEVSVSADLAVHAVIEGTESPYTSMINHNGALPTLPRIRINMYRSDLSRAEPVDALVNLIRQAYHAM